MTNLTLEKGVDLKRLSNLITKFCSKTKRLGIVVNGLDLNDFEIKSSSYHCGCSSLCIKLSQILKTNQPLGREGTLYTRKLPVFITSGCRNKDTDCVA